MNDTDRIDPEAQEESLPQKVSNPNAKWYILQAFAGYETRVEKTIREKLRIQDMEHLVEEIFIPAEDIVRTKAGKQRRINQKYFPGYVLIRMELTPDLWHLLMGVDRVSGFVGDTQKDKKVYKEPLPLDEEELDAIRQQINEGFQQAAETEEFVSGQKIQITDGPFSGFNGTIDEINSEKSKLKVLVSIFGRPTPVEVEFDKVKHIT
jgi:transcriptional antiterminator NusG